MYVYIYICVCVHIFRSVEMRVLEFWEFRVVGVQGLGF